MHGSFIFSIGEICMKTYTHDDVIDYIKEAYRIGYSAGYVDALEAFKESEKLNNRMIEELAEALFFDEEDASK